MLQGAVATLITMPLDVMKTRMMNAPPGTYSVSTRVPANVDQVMLDVLAFIVTILRDKIMFAKCETNVWAIQNKIPCF